MSTLSCLLWGFGASFCLAQVTIRLAPGLGLLDLPRGRRAHGRPVARVGGLVLVLTLLALCGTFGWRFPIRPLETVAVLAMAALGLLDDLLELSPGRKAGASLGLAVILAWSAALELAGQGGTLRCLGVPVPTAPWATFPPLVLMYWGLPQGFNLIDGADGLAMGYGLVVLGSLWSAGFPHPLPTGAMLACLSLNWPKAKLFLGDCGSLGMGLFLVLLAKAALLQRHPDHILWLFAYPAVDVTLVVAIRLAQGRRLGVGDRSHLHFQIGDRWPGLAPWVVPILLALAAMCSSGCYLSGSWRWIPCCGLALLVLLAGGLGARSLAGAWPRRSPARRLFPDGVQEDR